MPFDCTLCTSILDQPWITGFPVQQQPHYQPLKDCTYWSVLGSFNNCNVLKSSYKATSSEEIDKILQVLLYGISENMAAFCRNNEYGAINTIETATIG